MRMYLDGDKVAERLKAIPGPLRQKALNELDAAYLERGFKARSNGQDSNGHYIDVDIKPGTDLAQVYEFLQTANIAAVTVEPGDVERIYGKSPATLGIRRAIEINGANAAGLELLEPDNLADALGKAGSVTWDGFVGDEAEAEKFITKDLIDAGYLSERDVKTVDDWLEAPPEKMGLLVGDSSNRYSFEDMGEFSPDFEAEQEWGEEF